VTSRFNIALGVEYDGSGFSGWQRQVGQVSVQQRLEEALSRVADETIAVSASGRTDAGVHATGQVVSFTTTAQRSSDNWLRGANSLMPRGVRVCWVKPVSGDFHARFSALARRYMYLFLTAQEAPAIAATQVTWERGELDDERMHRAAQVLRGEHDFSSFRAASCQSRSPFRLVHDISVRRFADLVVVDITANAFLHHMVRNIVGALLTVGRGATDTQWMARLLTLRDRSEAPKTAPAAGLYLVNVSFATDYELPPGRPPPMLRALGDVCVFDTYL
jgi:tRNA pseudouridine38-40 synthase